MTGGRLTRRTLLGGTAAAGIAVAAAPASRLRAATPEVSPLTDRLAVVAGAGANVLHVSGPDGLILVDGGSPDAAADLLAATLGDDDPAAVQALFNTNWRLQHTGANELLGPVGTRIIAHENTRLWMTIDFTAEWEGRHYPARDAQARPNDTFHYDGGELEFGRERLVYGHLPRAHTDGDLYVQLPESNVLAVGGLLAVDRYPVLDWSTGGWIGGMIDANRALIDLCDSGTRILPAFGDVQRVAALRAQLEMLESVNDSVGRSYRSGHSFQEFLETRPTRDFDHRWNGAERFLRMVYEGAWGYVGGYRIF